MRVSRWLPWVAFSASCLLAHISTETQAGDSPAGAVLRLPWVQVVPRSEEAATVVFVTRIINRGDSAIQSPRINLHAPIALPHQTITKLEVDGKAEQLTDRWGSPVLVYRQEELAPHATLTGRWAAWAAIRQFRWDLRRPMNPGAAALSAEERDLYLRDAEYFVLQDPAVRATAGQATAGRQGDAAVLDGIFALVMDRLTYDRDGKWQPAPQVLASGKGSCSEYSYLFIALCRSCGIPTRYVGGIVGRPGRSRSELPLAPKSTQSSNTGPDGSVGQANSPFHVDRVFHRFPQAFVPGIGWVDFDPTRTDRANDKRLYFGRTPGPMLLTCVGDGGPGSLTGWDYLTSHAWQGQKAKASAVRMAWWFPPPPPKVRQQVAEFRRRLASAPAEQRLTLVQRALAIAHPFVLPWLDDLLYEPAPRVAAAHACLKIGGQGELAAVVNCLGRLDDATGDRQIGQLLDEVTGQQFGPDRRKWEEWLKTRTPRTPLPDDKPESKP
jgi:hypothetical protein